MFVNITYVIRFLNAKSFAMSLLNAKPFIGCCDRRTVQHSFYYIMLFTFGAVSDRIAI